MIDQAVANALKQAGVEIEEFDFAHYYFVYKDIVEKYGLHEKMNFDESFAIGMAKEITSNMIHKAVLHYQPDLVVMLNGDVLDPTTVKVLKKLGQRVICWQVDDPYTIDKTAILSPFLEKIFSVDRSCLPHYRQSGCKNVEYLPLGFIESIYFKQSVEEKYHSDLCFIGTPFIGSYRVKILDELIPFLIENKIHFKIIGTHVHGQSWANSLKNYALAKEFISEDFVSPEETAKYYNGAKIVLNIHRDSFFGPVDANQNQIEATSLNERAFNIGACGAFQIIDDKRDFSDFYDAGKDLEVFRNIDDLQTKIKRYLADSKLRESIAEQGYQKTIQSLSMLHSVRRLLESSLK